MKSCRILRKVAGEQVNDWQLGVGQYSDLRIPTDQEASSLALKKVPRDPMRVLRQRLSSYLREGGKVTDHER